MVFCLPCLALLLYFGFLGIFIPKHRKNVKLAFDCFWRKLLLRPCKQSFDQRIKSKVVAKLLRYPKLAKWMNKNFENLLTISMLLFFISFGYFIFYTYNLFSTPQPCPSMDICVAEEVSGWWQKIWEFLYGCVCKIKP